MSVLPYSSASMIDQIKQNHCLVLESTKFATKFCHVLFFWLKEFKKDTYPEQLVSDKPDLISF